MLRLRKFALIARLLFVFAIAVLFVSEAQAVSLHPDVLEKLKKDGTLQAYVEDMKKARSRGVDAPSETSKCHFTLSADGAQDTIRLAVILVDFSDNQWQTGPDGTKSYFEDLLFSQGVISTGSMQEFYLSNSYGQVVIEGDVYGWYRMPQLYSFYVDGQRGFGSYPQNAQKLVEDAVVAADGDADYRLYDLNGDGVMDRDVIVVHAGEGFETSGSDNQIHSHRWSMSSARKLDEVWMSGYTMQPEESGSNLIQIGVFCHEFGHSFGLPDLYDTDYSSEGLGKWSVMAGGSYNGGAKSPSSFDAWCKKELGFVQPIVLTENEVGHVFPQVVDSPHVVLLRDTYAEYFLIENRQRVGFDVGLPGGGLLIFHVDESSSGNTSEGHYLVALEQADGLFQLENNLNDGDAADPYPGSTDNREFSPRSTPNSNINSGYENQLAVWDISDSDSVMTANLDITYSRPLYALQSQSYDDGAGNGNGVLDLGETIDFYFEVENEWATAQGAIATLSASDERLNMVVPTVNLGTIPGEGGIAGNDEMPLTFAIPADMDTVQVTFLLTLSHTGVGDPTTFSFKANIGGARVLIVDDDNSNPANYEHFLTDALDSIGYTYIVWGKDTLGSPGLAQMLYPIVMWLTGDTRETTLNASDRDFIRDYIEFGGGLFITGQDIAEHLSSSDPELLTDYFHCTYGGNLAGQYLIRGEPGSEIGGGDSLIVTGIDGASNLYDADWLIPEDEADVCFRYSGGQVGGQEITDGYSRAVFFGFGFEAISSLYITPPNNFGTREQVLERIVNFLDAREATPNRPPTGFSLAFPADGDTVETDTVTLGWNPSVDIDVGDWVTYTLYFSDSDTSSWDAVSGIADTEYTVSNLIIDETYYWRVVASDNQSASKESDDVFSLRSTGDITPPTFTVSWVPNSVFPFELDIYLFASEPLGSMPDITLTTPAGPLSEDAVKLDDREAETYVMDYRVEQSGSYSITVCGRDGRENLGCTSAGFSAAPLLAGKRTILDSYDGVFRLSIPSDAAADDGLLLLFAESVSAGDFSEFEPESDFEPLYRLRTKTSIGALESDATLTVDLNRFNLQADEIASVTILRVDYAGWNRLQTQYDSRSNTITAEISEIGTYVLGKSQFAHGSDDNPSLPGAYLLHQNWPNPFNMETSIAFDLRTPAQTKLVIYNLLGQRVVTLIDQSLDAGSHTISWNGRSDSGNEVSSGVYFYRLESGTFEETKRMLLIK
ncbi:MAG: M6 family metalloprotease domain-containing protein [candidate division Zixibacteria bacterium]|nr:M6 family metalloprotease domain-containing protein [candidate division Zixibacteria bacterium]MBU1471723.1 M6 family metalloprotease domain-containing protein [candidate division Zixibacteria bacterium]MBU2625179.1 M6 family metalloprotease domain-containing protein [candidate division Zixibacteria bacterium]